MKWYFAKTLRLNITEKMEEKEEKEVKNIYQTVFSP